METGRLHDVRLAVALAHAVPRCVVELESPGGRRVRVGRSCAAGCTASPCAVRQALVEALAAARPEVARRLGLVAGPIRARVVEGPDGLEHVGLGTYRCGAGGDRVAFCVLLPLPTVEGCVRGVIHDVRATADELAFALERCAVRAEYDTALGTTVVVLEGPDTVAADGALQHLALRICAACRVEELLAADEDDLIGTGRHT